MRPINEIIIHCAATHPDWYAGQTLDAKIDEIRRWHKDRGWRDIGYHFVIDRNGSVGMGRPIADIGAHTKGHNKGTIGVCLLGGFGSEADDHFVDHYTAEQDAALRELIEQLEDDYPTIKLVAGHNRYSAKACPGFRVPKWIAQAETRKQPRKSVAETKTAAMGGLVLTKGSLVAAAGSLQPAFAGFQHLHQGVQYALIAGGVLLVGLGFWIIRDRLAKFNDGVR